MTLTDFQIAPARLDLHQGAMVLQVVNRGKTPHDLTLRSAAGEVVGHTPMLDPGRSATLPLRLVAGTYTSYCSLPEHESLGMRGTVTGAADGRRQLPAQSGGGVGAEARS